MPDAPLILGISGLRGIVGESLTPEVAMRYAAAFGTWLRQSVESKTPTVAVGRDGRPTVVIGRDGRDGGEMIHHAAIAGLLSVGCDVDDLGVVPTPTVGVAAAFQTLYGGGMVVTASHNPAEWNGLKCLVQSSQDDELWGHIAHAPSAKQAQEIIAIFEHPERIEQHAVGDLSHNDDAADTHQVGVWCEMVGVLPEHIHENLTDHFHYRIVLDSVNCSGTAIAADYMEGRIHTVPLFCDNSGIFPHPPEPTKENLSGEGGLCDAVPGLKADIGFAQDPDADRLAIVDEKGSYIGEEYTLVLAAEALLLARSDEEKNLASVSGSSDAPVICVNLSTSRMIDDVAQRHGARVVRTPVGEAHVVEMMKKLRAEGHDVILGGEGNGGVIWPQVTYVRDSLSAMALTLALMARTGKSISELVADMASYTIIKRKQPLASKGDAAPTLERIAQQFADDPEAEIDTQDGVRIDWPARKAWVHIRASNTEPILRLIGEAPLREEAEKILDQIERITPS